MITPQCFCRTEMADNAVRPLKLLILSSTFFFTNNHQYRFFTFIFQFVYLKL